MLRTIISFFMLFVCVFAQPVKPSEAFKISASIIEGQGVNIGFDIHKDVYLYADQLKFKIIPNEIQINNMLNMPKKAQYKEFEIYVDKFDIFIPFGLILSSTNLDDFTIKTEFSGCAYDGFCYQPQILAYNFKKTKTGYIINKIDSKNLKSSNKKNDEILNDSKLSEHDKIANSLKKDNFFMILATFFGYGVLLSLTPCIFPMIPILSSIIVAKTGEKRSVKAGFFISLAYVFAMAVAYAIAGVAASFFGASLQSLLQIPAVILIFSLFFVILAFSMFGFYEIKMPEKFQTVINKKSDKKNGMFGVFVMGFLSALIVGPCVAAPLAGALLYIAQTGDIVLGGSALFIMSFGMGLPLILIGAGSSKILPKPGIWMREVQNIFGFLLLGMAIWMSSRVFGDNLSLLFYGILGILFASFFGIFEIKTHKIKKGISFLILIYSVLLIIGFASNAKDVLKPLEKLSFNSNSNLVLNSQSNPDFKKISTVAELESFVSNSDKPVLIDFWATWCISCKELDNITFKDPKVIKALSKFNLVKIDVTNNTKEDLNLLAKFNLFGPPGLVFYKDGKELKDKQIVGFIKPEQFVNILDRI